VSSAAVLPVLAAAVLPLAVFVVLVVVLLELPPQAAKDMTMAEASNKDKSFFI
jgi:hypothetical protein